MASAQDLTRRVANGIEVLATIGRIEKNVMPYATFIAGFFPGAASVLSAIAIAQPYIDKLVTAAPAVEAAVVAGAPILQAIHDSGPSVLQHVKQVFAIFANADPARPETGLTADDVSDADAVTFAGPLLLGRPWTDAETQRYWDKATGGGGW